MALADMIKLPGVQGMLKTLLQSAAPELGEQVQQIADTIVEFKAQTDRIEGLLKVVVANQHAIARRLEFDLSSEIATGENHADAGRSIEGNTGPA